MDSADHEERITALESRMQDVSNEATIARTMAGWHESDIRVIAVQTRVVKSMLSAHVKQTSERLELLESKVDGGFSAMGARIDHLETRVAGIETTVDRGFGEMRSGFAEIAGRLDRVIESDN